MLGSNRAESASRPWGRLGHRAPSLTDPHRQLRSVIESAVAPAFAVASVTLWADTRGSPAEAFARQAAMYLAHVALGLSLTEVARLFTRDRTTVAHACALIEDRRDLAAFDRALDLLEGALHLVSQRQS